MIHFKLFELFAQWSIVIILFSITGCLVITLLPVSNRAKNIVFLTSTATILTTILVGASMFIPLGG